MAKKTSLAAALLHAAGNPSEEATKDDVAPNREEVQSPLVEKSAVPPSRQGKKAVVGHFDPAVSRQLKQIMLDEDTTVQALLAEALNDLFRKYGKKPIA